MTVAMKPAAKGIIFFLTNSAGSTPQIAATGITPQGMIVPPHTHTAAICPSAASPSLLMCNERMAEFLGRGLR
ncbi:hypothetical protein [Methanosarcina horonobensis]|uniref:hypothetical protein n=1 Tax=Methanosarcina horonobensis TaxID=418008 RepID=UPI00064E17EA|nr:hypothetical protein [Methanosarcina horonobensis]